MSQNSYSQADYYAKKAKQEGYRARSIYKLQEIDQKYHILKKSKKILDLGCTPGSWSEYTLKMIKQNIIMVGVDIKSMVPIQDSRFHFIQGDFTKYQTDIQSYGLFDLILSDMAPNTTGILSQDVFLSHELTYQVLKFSLQNLQPNGSLVIKVFQGEGIDDLYKEFKKQFVFCKTTKPKAVRKNSKEIYIVAKALKSLSKL